MSINSPRFIVGHDFDSIYHTLLDKVKAHGGELINASFTLTEPRNRLVCSKVRNFRTNFAEKFFQWIWDGKSDVSELHQDNPNAKKFEELEGRNTAYGPRLVRQLPEVLLELRQSKESRRGVILILEPGDQELLSKKRDGLSKMEYPCTIALTFFIRKNCLHLHASMRSNNVTTTICYDVYVFTRIQEKVLELLRETKGLEDLELGSYHHNMVSAHIVPSELDLARKILAEHFGSQLMRPSKDKTMLSVARLISRRSTCLRRAVGCVLVDSRGHIIGTGYNGVARGQQHCNDPQPHSQGPGREVIQTYPQACKGSTAKSGESLEKCEAIHAEANALLQCHNVWEIETCYVTAFPCIHCTKLLLNTACKRVIYLEDYPGGGLDLWERAGRRAKKGQAGLDQ